MMEKGNRIGEYICFFQYDRIVSDILASGVLLVNKALTDNDGEYMWMLDNEP